MKIRDVEDQEKILSEIIGHIVSDISDNFDSFEFFGSVDEESTECTLYLLNEAKKTNPSLSGIGTINVSDACMELHALMKEQQGKEWASFALTYQNGGKAEVKYNYDPLPES